MYIIFILIYLVFLTVILFVVYSSLFIIIEFLFRRFIYLYLKYLLEVSYILLIGSHFHTSMTNPGIGIRKRNKPEDKENYVLCDEQICWIDPDKYYIHCAYCDICCEDFDHHCDWVGKCIGKGNKNSFQLFLFALIIFIMFGIFSIVSALMIIF